MKRFHVFLLAAFSLAAHSASAQQPAIRADVPAATPRVGPFGLKPVPLPAELRRYLVPDKPSAAEGASASARGSANTASGGETQAQEEAPDPLLERRRNAPHNRLSGMDSNRDGAIDAREYQRDAVQRFQAEDTSPDLQAQRIQQSGRQFQQMDSNNDGRLSIIEQRMARERARSRPSLRATW